MLQGTLVPLALSFAAILSPFVSAACSEPRQRSEWRTLNDEQKQAYLDAVLCLQNSPAQTDIKGSLSRFDDFQATHISLTEIIHGVGQFLPWHRYMMWVYESILRDECGYTGTQPYWNETIDVADFLKSPLFDEEDPLSFGGNGDPDADDCVTTGPFADYTLHLGPGKEVTDHCLSRRVGVSPRAGGAAQFNVTRCLSFDTFEGTGPCIEYDGPHSAGHSGVGGEMVDVYSSPGDPIFYLHHAWVDKIWSDWQAMDKESRLSDIAGYTTPTPTNGSTEGLELTTLDYVLTMHDMAPDVTIQDVMDIEGETLCYVYI